MSPSLEFVGYVLWSSGRGKQQKNHRRGMQIYSLAFRFEWTSAVCSTPKAPQVAKGHDGPDPVEEGPRGGQSWVLNGFRWACLFLRPPPQKKSGVLTFKTNQKRVPQ